MSPEELPKQESEKFEWEKPVNFGERDRCFGLMNAEQSDNPKRKKGVLFVSGFLGDKSESFDFFREFAAQVHEDGFSTFRYDCSGVGESNKSLSEVEDVKEWAEDCCAAMDKMFSSGVEEIVIVGFSLGAALAILALSDRLDLKDKVKGLVMCAPALNPEEMLNRYKQDGTYEKVENGGLFREKPVSKKLLDSLALNVSEEIKNLDCPKIICHGEKDPVIPLSSSWQAVAGGIPNLESVIVVPQARHSFRSDANPGDLSPRKTVYQNTLEFCEKAFE